MLKQTFEIQEIILDQLKASRINGFQFFAYTGIKNFEVKENNTLSLVRISKNPNGITKVNIFYDYDSDTYTVSFFVNHQENADSEVNDIYFDQLAEIITQKMGVY